MEDVIFLCSHAEKVEARVDPAGDEDHEDTNEIKVARGCHHHTESREHCGCIQDPDGHIITESYNISYFPVFELLLLHPQLLLFLSKEVNLDITVGNQGDKAVAEQSYAELNYRLVGVVLLLVLIQSVEDISLQEESLLSAHADDVPVEGGPGTPDLR